MWIIGMASVLVFMTLLWAFFYKRTNAGIIDIGWALCFTIAGTVAILGGAAGGVKKTIFALMVYPWSIRLAWYLYRRFDSDKEDPRYTKIKRGWIGDKFWLMFLFQGILASIAAIPFYVITDSPAMGLISVGFIIVTIGWIGESIADNQLQRFKEDSSNRGKVLDQGLWGYSRHPNYFFEWIVWLGFTVAAITLPYGWLSLISFGLMSYLLMGLSGVRLTEEQLSESKGEAYNAYKRRVPAFFPRLKK